MTCENIPAEYQAGDEEFLSLQRRFYSERTIDPEFEYPPYSLHVRKILATRFGFGKVIYDP